MPRTRSLAWSELKIGILAVVALILATLIIIAVGGAAGFSWERYELKTKFPDVMGLKSGAVVRLAGVEVGKVTAVDFVGADVQVTLEVRDEMQPRITTDSRAQIGSLSLLGEPVIDLTPAATGRPLEAGEFIASERARGQISDVAESATEGLEQATLLLKDIRGGRGTVGKLFAEDRLYRDLQNFVASAETVTAQINRGRGTLGMLVNDPKAYRQFEASLANLQEMTRRINAGEGSLGRLLKDDAMARSMTSASNNIDQLTGRLSRGEGTAGKLLTDQQLYDRFNSLASRIDKLAAALEQGEGTAGALLQDKQLYENMNAAVKEFRALVAEVKKDPRKYLNVRVSIF